MKKSYIFAAISIFFWSTAGVLSKLLLKNYNSFQVLWLSALFGGIFLLGVNIFTCNIQKLKQYKFKDYAISALIGFPGTFLYYVFYYSGNAIMPEIKLFSRTTQKESMLYNKVQNITLSILGELKKDIDEKTE